MEEDEWALTAELAALELSEDERKRLIGQAEQMRRLYLSMSSADADNLEPTTHALAVGNRVRKDETRPFNDLDTLLDASNELDDRFFLIPNVL